MEKYQKIKALVFVQQAAAELYSMANSAQNYMDRQQLLIDAMLLMEVAERLSGKKLQK